MNAERAIHSSIFVLIFVGVTILTAWASYSYLQKNMVLAIATIPLSWGITLLVMYISFKKAGWTWWNS